MSDSDGPNPYAPPSRDAEELGVRPVDVVAAGALFSTMQIGVAAFFGSIIGGSLLLQANYRAFREARAANVVIFIGLAATLGIYVFFYILRQPFGGFALTVNLVAVVTTIGLARSLQRDRYEIHVLNGGRSGSSWWVLGAIVISFAVRLIMVTAVKAAVLRLR